MRRTTATTTTNDEPSSSVHAADLVKEREEAARLSLKQLEALAVVGVGNLLPLDSLVPAR